MVVSGTTQSRCPQFESHAASCRQWLTFTVLTVPEADLHAGCQWDSGEHYVLSHCYIISDVLVFKISHGDTLGWNSRFGFLKGIQVQFQLRNIIVSVCFSSN